MKKCSYPELALALTRVTRLGAFGLVVVAIFVHREAGA